jgi:hypothetical protein
MKDSVVRCIIKQCMSNWPAQHQRCTRAEGHCSVLHCQAGHRAAALVQLFKKRLQQRHNRPAACGKQLQDNGVSDEAHHKAYNSHVGYFS